MAYLVRATAAQLIYALSSLLIGDLPVGPKKTWAYREPLLRVEAGMDMFNSLRQGRMSHDRIGAACLHTFLFHLF